MNVSYIVCGTLMSLRFEEMKTILVVTCVNRKLKNSCKGL
jgi:hypothetical protein